MLTDFQSVFTERFISKYATNCHQLSRHTLNVSLHSLVKHQYRKTSENLKMHPYQRQITR